MTDRAPFLRTPITDLFGLRLPIVAGGLQWLATPEYVAAAGRGGAIGFVTAASYGDLGELRDAIRRTRDLADGAPWGVNVSMLPKLVEGERTPQVMALIAEERVPFVETSGRNPEAFLPLLHDAGIKVLHKVPTVRHALKAQSVGVDAVAVVGAECGGHPGMEMVGTFVQAAVAARKLTIPLVIGGGVGTGAHLVAALALGADGVIVGTRFLVADEIWANIGFKNRLLDVDETSTTLALGSLRNTIRVLANDTVAEVQKLEAQGAGLADLMPLISGKIGREAYASGDWRRGLLAVGQAVAFADRLEPLADILNRMEAEARDALGRLTRLKSA